tara:strand:+ start:467 stop:1462 length:996 start_codon:yes stop_codon:yes gene_type:complete
MIKKKLKILHVILSKGFSGSEKYVVDLTEFQKKKHFVYAITSKKNYSLNVKLKKKINVFEIGNFFRKLKIQKLIKNIKPNIVHTHLGESARLIEKSSSYKTISTMHMNYRNKDFKNMDGIIVSNKSQFKEIKKVFKGKIFMSYLWVNLPKSTIKKSIQKKKLNIPKKNLIFGSIGRFHPQKGFDILIECFQELNLKNSTLILIGNGHKEYSKLERDSKKFKIVGQVDNVSNYYNIFDICMFASRWESFGYSLIESMKFKKPIISSKHIGNKDWINKFSIHQFDINKKNQLKKLIKKLYKSRPLIKKYDLSMFEYKKNCEAITGIYKKLLVR